MEVLRMEPEPDAGLPVSALFATPAPPVAPADVAAVLALAYGVAGRLTPLGGERDQNLLVEAVDGRRLVLKLCHPAEDERVVDLEARALLHLAEAAPDLPLPRLVTTREGAPTIAVAAPEGTLRHGRLVTFLPGLPLAVAPRRPPQAKALGRLAARLDRALAALRHEGADRVLLWDLARAGETRLLLPAIESAEARRLSEAALDRLEERSADLAALPRQVVHGDLNPHNVLVDSEDSQHITGLIDFGDMVATLRAADPAIAASYLAGAGDGFEAALGLIAAYHAETPLTDAEVAALPGLVAARLAMSLAIGAWRAARHPENRSYILRNQPAALAGLEALDALGPSAAERVAEACRPERTRCR